MKYLTILVLLLLSCLASNTESPSGSGQLQERYYNGCYYVVTELGGVAHAGNCSNSIHR